MTPPEGSSKPPIIRSVVVFPQPDGPSMAKKLPRSISSDRSSTATTSSKRFVTRSMVTSADTSADLCHDVLDLRVVLERIRRQILAVAGLLVAAVRHLARERNQHGHALTGVESSHSGSAFFAASTARSASAWVPRGTSATFPPVAGLITSMVPPS